MRLVEWTNETDWHRIVNGNDVIRRLNVRGCEVVRQRGSHAIVRCPGGCGTTVPVGRNDLPRGTLGAIQRHLRECIGGDW
jgi:predicted RNA binding protein YcfA (HicA-like mRNA interferase family)